MDSQSKPQTTPPPGFGAMRPGFSLVELLAVILVISILMTVGIMGVRNLSGGKSTAAAVASVEGLLEEARLLAVGKGTNARLLVDVDDPEKKENYLRRVVIAYRHVGEDGVMTDEWVLANRGYQMPQGVYFSQKFSSQNHGGSGGGSSTPLTSESMQFYMLDATNTPQPVSSSATDWNGKYVFYEFNAEGICQTPGASLIVGSGVLRPGEDDPKVTGGAERDFSGLVVWRNGRSSLFRSPTQMGSGIEGISSNESF